MTIGEPAKKVAAFLAEHCTEADFQNFKVRERIEKDDFKIKKKKNLAVREKY